MKSHVARTETVLLAVAAFAGVLLVAIPPVLAWQYEMIEGAGPVWVTVYFSAVGAGAALLAGAAGWVVVVLWRRSLRKKERRKRHSKNPSELSADDRRREIEENLTAVDDLREDDSVAAEVRDELGPLAARLEEKRQSKSLEIVAFGGISSGKSSLLNLLAGRDVFATDARGGTTLRRNEIPWPGADRVTLVDTPGLGEIDAPQRASDAARAAQDADLVLLVIDGPLRDSEHALLERLGQMEKRVLVCLNKSDWLDESAKAKLLSQITEQTKGAASEDDVVAIRARPATRTRVRVLAGGDEVEETVEVEPDIAPLARRMMQVVKRDGSDLLLANVLLQSRGLVEEARRKVRESLDRQAWKIVNRYMWSAGGVAAFSPWPLVDLAAGCAISTQMVVELARVYRQDVDLETAKRLLGQMGKQLIAVLGTTAATPALVSIVASLLKTVPGAGTIAGGLLQGIVQALVTRWIGAVFIAYLGNEMQSPPGGLASIARREWQKLTSVAELHRLVQEARSRLLGSGEEASE